MSLCRETAEKVIYSIQNLVAENYELDKQKVRLNQLLGEKDSEIDIFNPHLHLDTRAEIEWHRRCVQFLDTR